MQDDDLTHAIIGNELPLCGQVQFLELSSYSVYFRHPSDENTWLLLLLCPNILTFDYLSPPRNAIWSPPIPSLLSGDSAPSLATFKSLQKLFLSHYIDVPFVANSFRKLSAIYSASFPLTHLKLHSCFGYFDSVIIDLLEALHSGSASLEVLILIGLQDADLVLFERITEFFPDILELSLDRRTGNRQTPPVQWLGIRTVFRAVHQAPSLQLEPALSSNQPPKTNVGFRATGRDRASVEYYSHSS
jgi:hypothetical protein